MNCIHGLQTVYIGQPIINFYKCYLTCFNCAGILDKLFLKLRLFRYEFSLVYLLFWEIVLWTDQITIFDETGTTNMWRVIMYYSLLTAREQECSLIWSMTVFSNAAGSMYLERSFQHCLMKSITSTLFPIELERKFVKIIGHSFQLVTTPHLCKCKFYINVCAQFIPPISVTCRIEESYQRL